VQSFVFPEGITAQQLTTAAATYAASVLSKGTGTAYAIRHVVYSTGIGLAATGIASPNLATPMIGGVAVQALARTVYLLGKSLNIQSWEQAAGYMAGYPGMAPTLIQTFFLPHLNIAAGHAINDVYTAWQEAHAPATLEYEIRHAVQDEPWLMERIEEQRKGVGQTPALLSPPPPPPPQQQPTPTPHKIHTAAPTAGSNLKAKIYMEEYPRVVFGEMPDQTRWQLVDSILQGSTTQIQDNLRRISPEMESVHAQIIEHVTSMHNQKTNVEHWKEDLLASAFLASNRNPGLVKQRIAHHKMTHFDYDEDYTKERLQHLESAFINHDITEY
jgi:hypothetical protein